MECAATQIRVLLVEDNATFRRFAMRFLAECGNVTAVAAGGFAQAIAQARRLHPDTILLDLRLPGTSGVEAIRLLQAAAPEARIIVLSLLDLDSYRQAAMEAGAAAFVSKASIAADLMPAIRAARREDPTTQPTLG